MNITQKALKRPITTMMIFLCLVVVGMVSSRLLPLEFFPDMDFPFVNVEIPYFGSTPEEIETQITRPVEEVLATISGIKRMVSNSGENQAFIHLRFDWGADTDVKAIEVKEKVDSIRNLLPADLERIFLRQFESSDRPVLQLRLSSDRDLSDYFDMLNRVLKRPLERINGVGRVEMYGVEKKEIKIRLIADRIIAHKVDLAKLSMTLRRSNFLVTAGRITDADRRFSVRPIGDFKSIAEIENIIIGPNNLMLKDIAKILYESPILTYGRHLDKKYAVGLDIYKNSGANTVSTGDKIKAELEKIGNDPRMKGIVVYFMDDAAEGIKSSLNELLKSGAIGASLAIFVLFFFLRRISTTFIVSLSVPFCLLVTLSFMYFFNMTLNILSMMGLLLAVGMLVDNAVVVTESIHRYQLAGGKNHKTVIEGVKEVALAITAGTLTTAIVFLPNIISSKNEISIQMKHVAVSFVIALAASLIMAQTIVPLLASKIKPPRKLKKKNLVDRIVKIYNAILKWLLDHPRSSFWIIILLIVTVAIPITVVKKDMFPQQDDRRLFLRYNINGNYTLEKVEEAVFTVEEFLFANKQKFEIKSVYSYYTGNEAQSTILLHKDQLARKAQESIRREIEKGLPKLAIAKFSFDRRRSMASEDSLKLMLAGKSSALLVDLSRDIAKMMRNIPGFVDVRSDAEVGEQEVCVVVDRVKSANLGFSVLEIANMVSVAMRGVNLRRFRDESGEIDVRVEFQRGDTQTLEQLQNLILFDDQQNPVKLSTLADFKVRRGPRRIYRENRITSMGVSINLKDINTNQARKKIRQIMQHYQLPPGYSWSFGSSFSFEDEATMMMLINTVMALLLIYFIMAALFESLLLPAAIWTSIIFAIIGVWWFFMFTGTTFSIMAWIGVLILIGVVVNNGIVLIDHINRLREKGLSRYESIIQAGQERVRPILMTAGTTVLSLVPLCVVSTQIGGDGPPYYPMARAIVGGLIFSTFVTLLILPRIYILLDDLRNWSRLVFSTARKQAAKPVFKSNISK